jgi:hypothetical protein
MEVPTGKPPVKRAETIIHELDGDIMIQAELKDRKMG